MKRKGLIARIHWNRIEKRWTKKTSKECPRFPYILVDGGWKTEIKPHLKTNPKGFVLTSTDKTQYIDKLSAESLLKEYPDYKKLLYNKEDMTFNINEGEKILFMPEGAFVLL